MRAVIQRVLEASVKVDGKVIGSCQKGYMILFCAMENDTLEDISLLAKKVALLRVFEDEDEKMNKSILDVNGEVLCISQFTLAADTRKGNRPSFIKALSPDLASKYYDKFCEELKLNGINHIDKGEFGADMKVSLINDGPVTIILDTDIWKKDK
ncbi:MAG: D-tyrosyl-tRNA(Tyr) deacylase [Clostridia bacterium]|nr:D-tyrosyl-tRNA(Tyr) deacylase [Clostridia bacterium]